MKPAMLAFCCTLLILASPQRSRADSWAPVRFMEGNWIGSSQGEPGTGTVHRSYQFILGGRFLNERNVSAYASARPNTPGELHEHWSFFSFDRERRRLVLRQFHQEGFVNQYVMDVEHSTPQKLIFVSESFENLDAKTRARETYDLVSNDEFTETFEVAPPGQDFVVYSRNSLKRVTSE